MTGPNIERVFRFLRNSLKGWVSYEKTRATINAVKWLVRNGYCEINLFNQVKLTDAGWKVPVYIVKYRNKDAGHSLYCGPSDSSFAKGIRTRYSTVIQKENAYYFLSKATAKTIAKYCNDSWTGEVIEL